MKNFESSKDKDRRVETITATVPDEIKEQFAEFGQIDKMPQGCAVIGGAARVLAFSMLNPNLKAPIPIRDIDVAFFDSEVDQGVADAWAEYLSPDDFAHGHGAQNISDLDEYMQTRDFTMNQVIYKNGQLIMSRRAIRDIHAGRINLCEDRYDLLDYESEWGVWDDGYRESEYIDTRKALKAILQKTVLAEYIDGVEFSGEDRYVNEDFWMGNNYDGFQMALALQKACEYGGDIPERFLQNLAHSEMFRYGEYIYRFMARDDNESFKEVGEILHDINNRLMDEDRPFQFRGAAAEIYENWGK